ncbi:hypothetical protein DL546_005460 [Coniochaeta pulveracea]|uniref:Copper transport protein n=1 Tax=Coniochaeta pulveracea TaxID=177199 RepID=A0A420Y3L6_9PEZI|nr:hypothetical protein DL546_005460 [Coniochaeta pulveracea]
MDHSSHHAAMDHGTMPGHGGMDDMCQMSMLFTWNTKNLCIVFKWWHIRSTFALWVSLLAVVAIGMGYEALREGIRRYEVWAARRADAVPRQNKSAITDRAHVIKSVLYAVQNFYAFMIMLIFMTYNGWVMLAVSVGAGLGYLVFGKRTTATKDTACH